MRKSLGGVNRILPLVAAAEVATLYFARPVPGVLVVILGGLAMIWGSRRDQRMSAVPVRVVDRREPLAARRRGR